MLQFPNGKTATFLCAAGALGLDGRDTGNGIIKPWKLAFRLLGKHRPGEWGLITKTLTYAPRQGRLRWWCPWRCVRSLGSGNWCNSVGLTNPGFRTWIKYHYTSAVNTCGIVIPSIIFDHEAEAHEMIHAFNNLERITAIEVNVSCPNVNHDSLTFTQMCQLIQTLTGWSHYPLIAKLGPDIDQLTEAINTLDGHVFAFDLINTVPFSTLWPDRQSPLAKYGLEGGVSGPAIQEYACAALVKAAELTKHSDLISGGGINSYEEICLRFRLGASAVALGVAFLRPWLPLKLKRTYEMTSDEG
jgi:dihydroorotate dehydrogenase (NAD+) catalytic subunit